MSISHSVCGMVNDVLYLVVVIAWTAMTVWVVSDAAGRGKSMLFWGLLTLLTGLIGVVLYAVSLATDAADAAGVE